MPSKKVTFDKLDYQIIQALRANARVSASVIARKLGANERTIRKRIDWLVQEGVIRLTAVMNSETFGYITAADIFLEADPKREQEIINKLMGMPEITYIACGFGSGEISIEARFKSNEQFREYILTTLPQIPGLTVTRYTLVPKILRNIDEWIPPIDDFHFDDQK